MKAKMKTPVYATADGVVEFSGMHKRSGYGNLVIIQHNYGFKTYFGHLNKIAVKAGKFVKKGDLIAYTGTTGMSNGPHLHYEVRYLARVVNPFWFLKWNVTNYQEIFKKEKKIPWQSLIAATANIKVQKQIQTPPSSLLAHLSKVR
jgi:murein DD-endopeptidase MepM/ murein hydrolase activator NlpD